MLKICAYSLRHATDKRILVEERNHLLMHEFGDGNVTKHISPPGTLFGIDKFHERTGAQSQVFHTAYRE